MADFDPKGAWFTGPPNDVVDSGHLSGKEERMFEERPNKEALISDIQQILWRLEDAPENELELAQKMVKISQQLEHHIWFRKRIAEMRDE
jgi:hypothetical protein